MKGNLLQRIENHQVTLHSRYQLIIMVEYFRDSLEQAEVSSLWRIFTWDTNE